MHAIHLFQEKCKFVKLIIYFFKYIYIYIYIYFFFLCESKFCKDLIGPDLLFYSHSTDLISVIDFMYDVDSCAKF